MAFVKGQSGNPKGRPRVGTSVAEYVRQLGGQNAKLYVDQLHAIATGTHDNVNARLSAINMLLERGFGKPAQDVNVGGTGVPLVFTLDLDGRRDDRDL